MFYELSGIALVMSLALRSNVRDHDWQRRSPRAWIKPLCKNRHYKLFALVFRVPGVEVVRRMRDLTQIELRE